MAEKLVADYFHRLLDHFGWSLAELPHQPDRIYEYGIDAYRLSDDFLDWAKEQTGVDLRTTNPIPTQGSKEPTLADLPTIAKSYARGRSASHTQPLTLSFGDEPSGDGRTSSHGGGTDPYFHPGDDPVDVGEHAWLLGEDERLRSFFEDLGKPVTTVCNATYDNAERLCGARDWRVALTLKMRISTPSLRVVRDGTEIAAVEKWFRDGEASGYLAPSKAEGAPTEELQSGPDESPESRPEGDVLVRFRDLGGALREAGSKFDKWRRVIPRDHGICTIRPAVAKRLEERLGIRVGHDVVTLTPRESVEAGGGPRPAMVAPAPVTPKGVDFSDQVLVVGNGPSALRGEMGHVIDGFGSVYRINDYETKGYEKHVGSLTTDWVPFIYCRGANMLLRGMLPKREGLKNVWVSPWAAGKVGAKADAHSEKLRAAADKEGYVGGVLPKALRKKTMDELMRASNHRGSTIPSTGMLIVNHLLQAYDVVWIHGFDHFEAAHHHYYAYQRRYANEAGGDNKGIRRAAHNGKGERAWFQQQRSRGRVKILGVDSP